MRSRLAALVALVAGLAAFAAGCATSGPPAPGSAAAFDAAASAAELRCQCRLGVSARHLESGRSYHHNGAVEFESASVIKIAVITEAMASMPVGSTRGDGSGLSIEWTLSGDGGCGSGDSGGGSCGGGDGGGGCGGGCGG